MIYEKREDLLSSESDRYPTLIENQMMWNKEFPGRGGQGEEWSRENVFCPWGSPISQKRGIYFIPLLAEPG